MNNNGCLSTSIFLGLVISAAAFMMASFGYCNPKVIPNIHASNRTVSPASETSMSTTVPETPSPLPSARPAQSNTSVELPQTVQHDGILRYYDTTSIDSSPFDIDHKKGLIRKILQKASESNLHIVSPSGSTLNEDSIDWAQAHALWLTIQMQESDATLAERDFIAHASNGKQFLVSTLIEPNGTVYVGKSTRNPIHYRNQNKSKLIGQFQLQDIENGSARWSKEQLNILGDALGFLSNQEALLLKDTLFKREVRSPSGSEAGLYEFEGGKQTITIFDSGFQGIENGFVGTINNPKSTAHHVIIHEIGHLLANRPIVQYQRALNSTIDEYNALVQIVNAGQSDQQSNLENLQQEISRQRANPITRPGPVIQDFQRHRSFTKGPTIYGDTSIHEAFAESYALFKLDPAALNRIDPTLYTWFASNQHLAFNTIP